MRLLLLATVVTGLAAPAWAGMFEDFTAICRDTDAAPSAARAAAQRLGFGPSTDPDAKEILRDRPGSVLLERKRGKEDIQLIIGQRRDPKQPRVVMDTAP